MKMKISLVIPAYNEEKNIQKTVLEYRKYLATRKEDFEIIVVNDGSTDRTLENIKAFNDVICVSYPQNRGKGYAVKRGVLRATGDYIFFTDADLSFSPCCIGVALERFSQSGANIVLGERSERRKGYPFLRRCASRTLNFLLRRMLNINVRDSQCGFKGFDKKTACEIFAEVECEGFGFDFEVLSLAEDRGKVCESIPLEFRHREGSKVNPVSVSFKMLGQIAELSMKRQNTEKRYQTAFFTSFFLLSLFRLSYLGYNYTPYLDDYVQYMLYPSLDNAWERVLTGGAGILFTRPLAGLADFFVWSRFAGMPGVAVLVISVLYALSAVFFYRAFCDAGVEVTPVFLIFYAFLPLNIEGTYWLSASSRIVVSLFLVSLCCRFLVRGKMLSFAFANAAAMCFYEQTALLALILPVAVSVLKKDKNCKGAVLAVIINSSLLGAYYLLFGRMSNNSERMWIQPELISDRIGAVAAEGLEMWGRAGTDLIMNGFWRGLERIVNDKAILWSLLLVVLVALFFLTAGKIGLRKPGTMKKLCLGIALAVVPLLPFVISHGYLNFRNAVPSLIGVALVFDGLLPVLFKRATPFILSLCTVCFLVVAVSEVCDYDLTARRDMEIIRLAAQSIPSEYENDFDSVVCSCSAPTRFEQNTAFNDHIISIRGSAWGITGPVRAVILKNKEEIINNKE